MNDSNPQFRLSVALANSLRIRPVIAWLMLLQLVLVIVIATVISDIRIETIPMQRIG